MGRQDRFIAEETSAQLLAADDATRAAVVAAAARYSGGGGADGIYSELFGGAGISSEADACAAHHLELGGKCMFMCMCMCMPCACHVHAYACRACAGVHGVCMSMCMCMCMCMCACVCMACARHVHSCCVLGTRMAAACMGRARVLVARLQWGARVCG